MNEQVHSVLLQEHEVLFLDFLGFATAVQGWDDERMESLIAVLEALASAQSDFDIKGEPQDDGSYRITSPAEITTFSDHIVVSYPYITKPAGMPDDVWGVISSGWADMVRQQMAKITAQVAIAGLDVGLLVRGGLSRGKLYHRGRVVVGEAMVDAYRLESEVARNARVVVSPRIIGNDRLFTDTDGERCLDYIGEMMLQVHDRHGDVRDWVLRTLEKVEATMNALNENGQSTCNGPSRRAAKWSYFRDKLRDAMETWN